MQNTYTIIPVPLYANKEIRGHNNTKFELFYYRFGLPYFKKKGRSKEQPLVLKDLIVLFYLYQFAVDLFVAYP
jgi:hypothetical protein